MTNTVLQERLLRLSFFLFLFSIPFGTKKFLFPFALPFSNVYVGEYTAAFLFGSDILLLFFLFCVYRRYRIETLGMIKRHVLPAVFAGIALVSLVFSLYPGLGLYEWVRLLLVVLAAYGIAVTLRAHAEWFRGVIYIFAFSAVIQAIIGFLQFLHNRSVGFPYLGESVITAATKGVARVSVGGEEFLRALGTMPHANILAGFLLIGLVSLYYLLLTNGVSKGHTERIGTAIGIFVVIVGLAVTFSRSGWIAGALVTVLMLAYGLVKAGLRRNTLVLLVVLALVGGLLVSTLGWVLFPRAGFAPGEGSVVDRYSYDIIGLRMVSAYPLGVGIGNQLWRGVTDGLYQERGLTEWWRWQPIHNIYLMIATETGVVGLLVFLMFFVFLFVRAKPFSQISTTDADTVWVICIGLLVFGLVDHFLWDLEAGRLMLWAVLGILMAEKKGARS